MTRKNATPPTEDEWALALRDGDVKVVAAGLEAGRRPDDLPRPSWAWPASQTPLRMAMKRGHGKVATLLIERGADVNRRDGDGVTPLHWAAVLDLPVVVQALVSAGADPAAKLPRNHPSLIVGHKGSTPLDLAVAEENTAMARLLQGLTSRVPLPEPSAVERKLAALRGRGFGAIDFEGSAEPVQEALVGVDRPECFATIGKSGSDSVFALWRRKPAGSFETAPVVYLDSEGDPRSVVAASLDELLSLLPYGTATLHDLLADPRRAVNAKQALKAAAGAEPDVDGKRFLTWWKATFGVSPAKDPAAVIAASAKATASFRRWLKTS